MSFTVKPHYTLEDCAALIRFLRRNCPWDREQTHQSIRRNLLEEAYEAADAIDRDDADNLCEELGDVLTQVLFHADLEDDAGRFDLQEVCDRLCHKMIFRHPNLFGDEERPDTDDWETLKRAEKGQRTHAEVLRAIPAAMPALWRADKMCDKAEHAGVRYATPEDAVAAAQAAVQMLDEDTYGEVLLALVAAGHALGCDPERALNDAVASATDRFAVMEQLGTLDGTTLSALWE